MHENDALWEENSHGAFVFFVNPYYVRAGAVTWGGDVWDEVMGYAFVSGFRQGAGKTRVRVFNLFYIVRAGGRKCCWMYVGWGGGGRLATAGVGW